MTTRASWRDSLANAQPGDYLLTKFADGYRLWRLQADGTVGGAEAHPELVALFGRLNAATDLLKSEIESVSADDDEDRRWSC